MQNFRELDGYRHLTGLPCIEFSFAGHTAVVSLYGGQVLSYQHAGEELLWLSSASRWQQMPIRGGIPICWPWFGPLDSRLHPASGLPNHGLVRTQMWQQVAAERCADHALLVLAIEVDNVPWQPGVARLQASFQLDAHGLTVHLHEDSLAKQQAALHSYFKCEQVTGCDVSPLPDHFINKINANDTTSSCLFGQPIDRIYPTTVANLQLQLPHRITLSQSGHDAVIVWNPAAELAANIADLAADDWQQFVCVETARLAVDNSHPLDLHARIERM